VILPQVQDDEETQHVTFDRFESFMVKVMVERRFEPDTEETILQAFKTLDTEGKGHIDEQTMVELLTSNESAFREKEIEDFLRVARDTDTGFVFYEDYVSTAVASTPG
jgi:Ca2+-binding EF-hand superfamily protein